MRVLEHACRKFIDKTEVRISFAFSDGTVCRNCDGAAELEIEYMSRRAEFNSILFGKWGLIESYINGTVDIRGDIRLLVRAYEEVGPDLAQLHQQSDYPLLIRFRNTLHEFRYGNSSVARGLRNARLHYDRGTEMFGRYLDPTRTYTCAYWKQGTRSLSEAQWNKLDHVCRKLMLRPGDRLVDVGGGWGSLLFHACENYGAHGVNCSPAADQNRWMQAEIERRGLTGRIRVEEKDFRQVTGTFDKYASLGVYEHAGKGQLEQWVRSMAACLKPGGIGLLHFIAHDTPMETDFFIRKYIFPGGYLPGLSETIALMSKHGLEILDIENLRRHYALTLDAWASNFETNWPQIHSLAPKLYDERFRRIWNIYLNSCAEYFRIRNSVLRLYQITFSKGNSQTYPMDRSFLYSEGALEDAPGSEQKMQMRRM